MSLLENIENNLAITDPLQEGSSNCSGCGATFQLKFAKKAGFISPDRHERLIKLKEEIKAAKLRGISI